MKKEKDEKHEHFKKEKGRNSKDNGVEDNKKTNIFIVMMLLVGTRSSNVVKWPILTLL
jgi:hypothetical protein